MFKLQVVLVPPSAQNAPVSYGLASSTAESSQLLGVNPLTNSRNPDSTLPYAPSGNASALLPHHFSTKMRKFLHFTKSASTLLELSAEIVEKCNKMYPYVEEIEVLSLQDSQGCDLDPDFLVKDVFTMDNIVRAIVKNELEIDDSSPVSSYRAAKRKRLNNGSAQGSVANGVLNIAKKRPAAFAMRQPPPPPPQTGHGNNMRVSTPLAHQIYPPPSESRQARIDSNNSEEEDEGQGERSFLPPPAQPQSPPIRVSSGIDQSKKIKTAIEDDTVSRSETVDPDKLRQQRLLSGTPVRSTMTPNRVTLTGQRVVSENQPGHLSNPYMSRKPSSSATRITSGRLSIPEPKISEIEKELKEGPSSPSSVLPPKPDRIPMKKPLQENEAQKSDEELGEDADGESDESEKKVRQFIQRQTSIADNNGSPTKNSPLSEENFHLAELPQARPPSEQSQLQRKTSLEAKVEHKSSSSGNMADEERLRIDNFSENEEEGVHEKEHDKQLEGQLDRVKHQQTRNIVNVSSHTATRDLDGNDSDNETANDTVVVRDNRGKPSGNHSINREELLRFMEGDESPTWSRHSSKKKPYTTVLHKDIDNSKPDPRNILPEKMTRSAAKKAAQLLSGRVDESSDSEPERNIEESSADDGSSDIESEISMEDDDDKVAVTENNAVKMLNIHPLKETVIKTDQKPDQHEESEQSEGTSFGSSSDHERNDQPVRDRINKTEAPKIVVQNSNAQKVDSNVSQPSLASNKPLAGQQQEKISTTASSPQGVTLSRFRAQFLNSEKELPKSSPASPPSNNEDRSKQFKFDSSPTALSQPGIRREATDPKSLEPPKSASLEDAKKLKEALKQVDLKAKKRAMDESKRVKEQAEARRKQEKEERLRLKQQEAEKRKQEAELRKKKQQEELVQLKEQQFKRQQEELERKKKEFYEKKRQEGLERQKREEENRKREEENRRKEAEAEKKRLEMLEKQRQEEIKKRQEEEKKNKEELERKEQEELEKKRQEEELAKRRRDEEELQKKKQQEEIESKRREEIENKKKQEEVEEKKLQEEAARKKKIEELNKKKEEDAERKRIEKEQQEKKTQELEKKKEEERSRKQEELQRKKQVELEKKKQQQELQKKKQVELGRQKEQNPKNKIKSPSKSTISKPAAAKSPAIANGGDKLKELKARFTSPKSYVPTSASNSQQSNKSSESDESDSSDDESSTEYSSSSSEDEDESSSKKSRRMVVNTPKGSVTTGNQKSVPKKALPEGSIEAAPQSTQRSNNSSQRSQGEASVSRMSSSPGRGQPDSKENSSILDGLPKKIRPSLSSLSDLASRGVPEVREKGASLSPPPHVTKASTAKKIESDSDNDESGDNDASDTESESSDSDSDDSDSGSSGFISAKTAGSALGKKKKGGGGFASLLRDSQRK